jgi:hypothetical protein
MFKKTDPNPQLDMFTSPTTQLCSRASKKYTDPNAWHNMFYRLYTSKVDEELFKPLFPEGKKSGRPKVSFHHSQGSDEPPATCLYTTLHDESH